VAEIQLGIYRLTGYDWGSMSDSARRSLIDTFIGFGFAGPPGRQYGVPNPQVDGAIAWGRFAHQTSELLMDYVHGPAGDEQVPREELTYEHYWYAISFEAATALIQQRRLPSTKDLSNQEVLRSFEEVISQAVVRVTGRLAGLIPLEVDQPEESLRELLGVGRVLKLRVTGLAGRRVPDSVDLTNPDPDVNGVLHDYMNFDYGVGVSDVTLAASEDDPDADVRRSFYAKAVVATGRVTEVEAEVDGVRIKRARESRKATIATEEPLHLDAVRELIARVAGADLEPGSVEIQDTLFGRGVTD
jgi:hypothetical protein